MFCVNCGSDGGNPQCARCAPTRRRFMGSLLAGLGLAVLAPATSRAAEPAYTKLERGLKLSGDGEPLEDCAFISHVSSSPYGGAVPSLDDYQEFRKFKLFETHSEELTPQHFLITYTFLRRPDAP